MIKFIKKILAISIAIVAVSCSKDDETTSTPIEEKWEFTKIVNVNSDNSEGTLSIDFYQKRGNQWRIVQMEPDDYTKFYLKGIKTPNAANLPVTNNNAFMTVNPYFFEPISNSVYYKGNTNWILGDLPTFGSFSSFSTMTPDMPASSNQISKFQGATFSKEKPYNDDGRNDTYLFYDFNNQKYTYYGTRVGTDLILENRSLPNICSNCSGINWASIDAVTSTKAVTGTTAIYYFFDFDAGKMIILFREGLDTNNPHFLANYDTLNFSESFKGKFGTPEANTAFDFTK
jgi:hypothetical protein